MTTLPGFIYSDLVGKPFVEGGRGPEAYDCWGLLQRVQQRVGRRPTDFPSRPELLAAIVADEWEKVERDAARATDAILLRSSVPRYVWHIGVIVSPGNMLHARESVGVCVERYDSLAYNRRIVGFYRFRGPA